MHCDEYLINRTDGDWFDFRDFVRNDVFKTKSFESKIVQPDFGHFAIEAAGIRLSFCEEMVGLHVLVENVVGEFKDSAVKQILTEVLENIEDVTKQQGEILEIGWFEDPISV